MCVGTVIAFDKSKGSGVIAPDDGTRHVSIRVTQNESEPLSRLAIGQRVSFDNGRGLFGNAYARNIVVIS